MTASLVLFMVIAGDFLALLVPLVIGIVGMCRTPKTDLKKRKSYRMMIVIPLVILGTIVLAFCIFLAVLMNALAHGM